MSVVVPAHDRPELLHRTLESVLRQTFESWEVIVVDDASPRPLAPVVEGMRDVRFRCVRRARNGGVAAAQNTGLELASGRYVKFLHSDDELLPSNLERLTAVLDASVSEVGGVESGHEERYEDGSTVAHRPYLGGASAADVLAYRVGVHISKLLLRREAAAAVRFDERLRGAEDRDFAIRLLRATRIDVVDEPLVRIERMADGLRAQSKGAIYEYLLRKYQAEITADPALERSWWFRVARAYARSGASKEARVAMRHAVRAEPSRARLWPLGVASLLGDGIFTRVLGAYQRVAGGLRS